MSYFKKTGVDVSILTNSLISFVDNNMLTHAAAISYYTIFSLPAMLFIVLWVAVQLYSEAAVYEATLQKITSLVGDQSAQQIMSTIEKLDVQEPTWLATVVGVGVLLFFATTVFDAIRTALNDIAQVKASDSMGLNIWMALRVRFIAFGLLTGISFLLIVSLMLDVILTSLSPYLVYWIGEWSEYILILDGLIVDFMATTLLFSLYFRYLPDMRLRWSDALFGALLTAALFEVGKSLIGMLISDNHVVDLYGAAGSLLALMLWIYYATAIFLFGATFTFTRIRRNKHTVL